MLCSRGQLASEAGLIRSPAKAACNGQFRAPCLTKLSSPGRRSRPILSLGRLIDRNAPDFATVLASYQDFAAPADQFGADLPHLLRKFQRHPHGLVIVVEERAGDTRRVLRVDQIEVISMHAEPNLPAD